MARNADPIGVCDSRNNDTLEQDKIYWGAKKKGNAWSQFPKNIIAEHVFLEKKKKKKKKKTWTRV